MKVYYRPATQHAIWSGEMNSFFRPCGNVFRAKMAQPLEKWAGIICYQLSLFKFILFLN